MKNVFLLIKNMGGIKPSGSYIGWALTYAHKEKEIDYKVRYEVFK